MKLEEAKERLEKYLSDIEKMGYRKLPNDEAIETVLQEIEHLQKENRELKKEIEYIEEDRHNSAEAYKDMLKEQQRYYEERMEETY